MGGAHVTGTQPFNSRVVGYDASILEAHLNKGMQLASNFGKAPNSIDWLAIHMAPLGLDHGSARFGRMRGGARLAALPGSISKI